MGRSLTSDGKMGAEVLMLALLALLSCGGRPVPSAEPVKPAPSAPSGYFCFQWVHGPDFSTDCYESAVLCEQTRAEMGRDSIPCEAAERVSCTTIARSGELRCFGDLGNCGRYRNYIAGNGLESSPCNNY
jgi:hypothetical protein